MDCDRLHADHFSTDASSLQQSLPWFLNKRSLGWLAIFPNSKTKLLFSLILETVAWYFRMVMDNTALWRIFFIFAVTVMSEVDKR